MALLVSDILRLTHLKNMHVEAGAGGLNRYVVPFDESSFVISSLLFAKDEPTLILPAVKSLNSHGISAFAYKKIFFDQLPQEVKDFAESNNFPILSFDGDSYFENIIFEIMDAVEHDNARILSESRIQHIIDNEPTASEALELKRNCCRIFCSGSQHGVLGYKLYNTQFLSQ